MPSGNSEEKLTLTRRDSLKLLGAGSVFTALQATITSAAEKKAVDVVIVGAGFAGMIAARNLIREGRRVVLLEARNRAGGRVKSGVIAGRAVDVGGMWVGPTQTKLLTLIKECGFHLVPQFATGKGISIVDGKRFEAEGEDFGFPAEMQSEIDTTFAELDRLSAQVPLDAPWTAAEAVQFDNMTVEDWLLANVKNEGVRNVFRFMAHDVYQAEPFQMSFLFFLFYIRSGDKLETLYGIKDAAQAYLVEEGLHGVAEKLATKLERTIQYNAPVRKISQTTHGVVVSTEKEAWKADHCIVAVPLPLSVRIAFDPPLPPSRDALAQRMPMGSVIKWYLAYETPFWRGQGWNGLSTNFSAVGIECIDVTPAAGKPGLLVGFFDAKNGLRWMNQSATERKKFVTGEMVRVFGPAASQPIDYEDQNWPAEEWSRGCFGAWMGPGVMTSVGSAIREPHGRVHWAGTETSPKWMGYVDGAIRSGERAAEEVLAGDRETRGMQSGTRLELPHMKS